MADRGNFGRMGFIMAAVGSAIGLAPGISALVIGGEQAMHYWDVLSPYLLGVVVLFVLFRVVQRLRKGPNQPAGSEQNG